MKNHRSEQQNGCLLDEGENENVAPDVVLAEDAGELEPPRIVVVRHVVVRRLGRLRGRWACLLFCITWLAWTSDWLDSADPLGLWFLNLSSSDLVTERLFSANLLLGEVKLFAVVPEDLVQ